MTAVFPPVLLGGVPACSSLERGEPRPMKSFGMAGMAMYELLILDHLTWGTHLNTDASQRGSAHGLW